MTNYQPLTDQTKQKLQVSFKQMVAIAPDQAFDKLSLWLDKLPSTRDADYPGNIVLPDRRFLGSLSEYLYASYIEKTDMASLMKANKALICRRSTIFQDHPVTLETVEKANPIIESLITLNTVSSLIAAGQVLHTQINTMSYYNGPDAYKKNDPRKKSLLGRIEKIADTLVSMNTFESVTSALHVLEKDQHDEKAYEPVLNALVEFDTRESRKLAHGILWSRRQFVTDNSRKAKALDKQMSALEEKPIENTKTDIELFVNSFNVEEYTEKYAAKSANKIITVL